MSGGFKSGKWRGHSESWCRLTSLWGKGWLSHSRVTLAVWGVAPSCSNQWQSLLKLPQFWCPRAVQYCCRPSTYCSFVTVSGSPFSSSNQNGPMMPCFDIATHVVHFFEWSGLCSTSLGADVPQNMLFLLLTFPDNKMLASSLNQMSLRKFGLSLVLFWNTGTWLPF